MNTFKFTLYLKVIGFPEQNRLKPVQRQPKYPMGIQTPKMPRKLEHVSQFVIFF
jgi:hypothetical protein